MRVQKTNLLLIVSMMLLSSCASIVSKSIYPISIKSSPDEAEIVITDKKGIEVYSGSTPATVKLKSGSGFFGAARYQVEFSKDGYDSKTVPISCTLDGWYFGNIVFGGLIGMLIVDPATGAMYKLETKYLNETLSKSTASLNQDDLRIYALSEIPKEWNEYLILLNK